MGTWGDWKGWRTDPIFIHENTISGSSPIVMLSITVCGSSPEGISEVSVIWGRKLGTFSSPKWVGIVVVIRRIKAASMGLPSGGHSQREASKFKYLVETHNAEKPVLDIQPGAAER